MQPLDKVLEIGTGSAYQAALLAEMGADVFTIERQKKLFDRCQHFEYLQRYPILQFFYGDGYEGLPRYAPFDKIVLTAAAPQISQVLVRQLKTGGMMVLPFGEHGESQRMIRLIKLAGGEVNEERFGAFSFVSMLEGRKKAFGFLRGNNDSDN
ncbi:protein-L-isoaspartate O-methyltransferase family protein [Flavisolibacter nicotianae]|uniref:protein-L-isoaspartate O-methyltransferase family protein n=1 Tax=Flavisolibacter nicotianae TaxID=2364882 RepID=UPI001F0A0026|nr:hypothetical protein [Flavisolibacter nicotianae]